MTVAEATAVKIGPGLMRLRAPNASPMTGSGTNSWILGEERVLIVDPGPEDDSHLVTLIEAVTGREVAGVLVTHSHRDHVALAPRLAGELDVPLMGYGPVAPGRVLDDLGLEMAGTAAGGEGQGAVFRPDIQLADGERVEGWQVIHTPGHLGDHICLWRPDGTLVTGDHVMSWSSSIVAPPAGDMGDYMRSLDRLAALRPRLGLPGHGEVLTDPAARIAELGVRRRGREARVLAALADGVATCPDLTARLYRGLNPVLIRAAELTCLAHLVALAQAGQVETTGGPWREARFALVPGRG